MADRNPAKTQTARRYINEMRAGERYESQTFLVQAKDLRQTTQGALYIHCVLADRSGQMPARVWQASEAMYEAMPAGGFLGVKGRCESYKGNLQFIIEAIRPLDVKDVDLSEFLPRTDHDTDEMWGRVREILGEIQDAAVAALVQEFVDDAELMERFKIAPAAVSLHHAYIGGLLEHTLSVLEVARLVMPRYPKVNADLVLAGVFLHDLGKTEELNFTTNFHYSDRGQLLGHISLCVVWLQEKAAAAAKRLGKPLPERLLTSLQHIVLSHHAKPEFGSPKFPATPEALAVHYLDNLDAKLSMSVALIEGDRDASSRWTNYSRALETRLYKPNPLENGD